MMSAAEEAKVRATRSSFDEALAKYGSVTLTYSCEKQVDLTIIEQEFESGACFALYRDHEDLVCGAPVSPANVRVHPCEGGFTVSVADAFLPRSLRFTRLTTSFLANLLDFGPIRLMNINIDQSQSVRPPDGATNAASLPTAAFGTIVKPYFRLSNDERVGLITRFADAGFDLAKEDECHIVSADEIIKTVTAVARCTGSNFRYVPNITGIVSDYSSVQRVIDSGARVVMVNALIVGLQSVSDLASHFPGLSIWVHRVGYAAVAAMLSRQAFTQLAVLSGASMIHVGTPVTRADLAEICQFTPVAFQEEGAYRPVFTKLTPEVLQPVSGAFGSSAVYMVCGWIRDPYTGLLDANRLKQWRALADEVKRIYRTS
jgi:Ribulose bisphosphate carboxylase large chain, catalytic domain